MTSSGTLYQGDVAVNGDTFPTSSSGSDRDFAYVSSGRHYIQIDLGAVYDVDQVNVWHYFNGGRTYHDTWTQVSAEGVHWTEVFSSTVLGEYAETSDGLKLQFPAPKQVRYVRDWLNGSTANAGDHWVEIEVWGKADVTYIGNYYEWRGSAYNASKYYYAGSQRVALRRGGSSNFRGVAYMLTDHLGSTSMTVDPVNGNKLTELRYRPFGETYYTFGSTQTNLRYTGQCEESGIGLYYYGARWYSVLGRFVQADTIIPEAVQGTQAWDRYAYVNNNPLRYSDPSGHCIDPDSCYPSPPLVEEQYPPIQPENTGHLDNDKFGIQILSRYLTAGEDWYITNDPAWTDYMSNNATLIADFDMRSAHDAQYMYKNGLSAISINQTYSMEIDNGEGIVGYQYLHGTDQTAGGFQRQGVATMSQTSDGGFVVTFSMTYTFNDIIDSNPKYQTDVKKNSFAEIITFGKADPYEIHISWSQTTTVNLDSQGNVIPK